MLDLASYKIWTTDFGPGCRYEGSWDLGSDITFLSDYEGGLAGTITQNKYLEVITITYKGWLDKNGVLDESDASLGTKGSIEQYTFTAIDDNTTKLDIYAETSPEYHDMMAESWPKALDKLKEMCEEV